MRARRRVDAVVRIRARLPEAGIRVEHRIVVDALQPTAAHAGRT
jgi:hypothetical protein